MTHARITFWAVLAAILAIVAISVVTNAVSEIILSQIFIASTVFSLGIIVLDFMGFLGQDQHGDAGGDGDATFDGAIDGAGDGMEGDFEGFDGEGGDGQDADIDALDTQGHGLEHQVPGHLSDIDAHRGSTVLSVLAYLRMLVYFCLGFGPTGLAGITTGRSALTSLLLAIPSGVIALFLAQSFFKFQRSDTDSSLRQRELLHATATVTVPLTHRIMGRVRIQLGMNVSEQFALAEHENDTFTKGDTVRILRVSDECVYVA